VSRTAIHALPGVAPLPDLLGADLRGAVGEVGVDEAVEPDARDSVAEGRLDALRPSAVGRGRPCHGLPEVRGVRAVRGQGGALDDVQVPYPGRPLRDSGRAARVGWVRVGDDQRQRVTVRIIVFA
jgi:hypothetical protein